jgi:hypothetical protein
MDRTPAEKIINIDGDWLHTHAWTAEPLQGIFGRFQPFGVTIVQSLALGLKLRWSWCLVKAMDHVEWMTGNELMRSIAAAALYFLIVFGVGFLLGPIRVFWLESRVGEAIATLCEAPFFCNCIGCPFGPKNIELEHEHQVAGGMGLGALVLVGNVQETPPTE